MSFVRRDFLREKWREFLRSHPSTDWSFFDFEKKFKDFTDEQLTNSFEVVKIWDNTN